ncbi:GNAT family N-acetyltransferase [Paenibacillus guangzhouensis]|uniref:GNAT family N-acetyltransferase n=1 Tax=Paenibacillus guangzhouensis TaxID=1473112 RepID=UPI0012675C55|nr:GNAT family N-acetyltransferase [Paenibacillus guangzhouensis]
MIRLAGVEEAHYVHQAMMAAFEEYRNADVPSSALHETVSSVEEALRNGSEQAVVCMNEEVPLGSARFKIDASGLYFSRLSVSPEARGRGIAKRMLSWLENYAGEQGKSRVWCRVRMSAPQNIRLYQSVGYQVYREEMVINPNGFAVNTVLMEKII